MAPGPGRVCRCSTHCPNWFAGRILDRVPLGDHVGHVLDPFAGEDPAPELGWYPFSRAKQIEPGHEA